VLSQDGVFSRLRDHFIGLRMDWEQGNHFKDRFGFIPGTGDQLLLDPAGTPIRHDDVATAANGFEGARKIENAVKGNGVIFGRHGVDTTPAVLDAAIARHPKRNEALRIEWFLWPEREARRRGGRYPPGINAMAAFARLPIAEVHGEIPAVLRDERFLRDHVRQFIWVRANDDAPPRIVVRRVRDGLPADLPTFLAELPMGAGDTPRLAPALDRAWLEFMKNRPLVARGYLDNEHGGWMRGRRDQMMTEDNETRRRARDGTLRPPGRP
jgi:hypothetical protein